MAVCEARRVGALAVPGGELKGAFVGGAGVHRLAVRDDDALERKLKQRAKSGQSALLMRGRGPNTQLAHRRRQRVSENEGTLLGQPQRRLVAAASVVEGEEPARKLARRQRN